MPEGGGSRGKVRRATARLNQLEPDGLLAAFAACPPDGFVHDPVVPNVPAFIARFDLLTTTPAALRRRVRSLPGYARWRALLEPRTYFVGTTVSEYAIFDEATDPTRLVDAVLRKSRRYRMTVIRDLPSNSPLVDARENAYADRVAKAASDAGFSILEGQALAYVPIDFASVDAFIERLSRGGRRNVRRKLRVRATLDVERIPTGDARFTEAAFRARLYDLYLNVYRQSETHFDRLSAAFFDAVLTSAADAGVVFLYRRGGVPIGFNLCYVRDGLLVDKYLGLDYSHARDANLYCVSWFENLAYAREQGLHTYVAGWTDPEVKASLGARFTFTRHAVYIRNPILRVLLRSISTSFEADRAWHDARSDRP